MVGKGDIRVQPGIVKAVAQPQRLAASPGLRRQRRAAARGRTIWPTAAERIASLLPILRLI